MEHRTPSVQLAPRTNSEIRRRSGRGPRSSINEENAKLEITQEDHDQEQEQNEANERTILLVDSAVQHLAPSAILPFVPTFPKDENKKVHRQMWDGRPIVPFSPVPLTPMVHQDPTASDVVRPGLLNRGETEASFRTVASSIPSLPTPDFGRGDRARPKSFLNLRGLSFAAFRIPTMGTLGNAGTPTIVVQDMERGVYEGAGSVEGAADDDSSRPASRRTSSESDVTFISSAGSDSTSVSVDCGRRLESMRVLGTTSKFMDKWPLPAPLRYVDPSDLIDDSLAREEGRGGLVSRAAMPRWTGSKWCLVFSVSTVLVYSTAGLGWAILTWFKTWRHADVMLVADYDILILITTATSVAVFAALIGLSGVILNSRPGLATYSMLLWVALLSLVSVGYVSYKRSAFSLDHKLDLAWSQIYTPHDRLVIQNSLQCCGYYSPLHDAMPSKWCYTRSPLPGCKANLYRFEWYNLGMVWLAAFSFALLHLFNFLVALLCANHVDRTFGRGLMPKRYRLTGKDVRDEAERILRRVRGSGDAEAGMEGRNGIGWLRQDEEDVPLLS